MNIKWSIRFIIDILSYCRESISKTSNFDVCTYIYKSALIDYISNYEKLTLKTVKEIT